MDKIVYTDPAVADFINEKFVSVKVQLDSTSNDRKDVRDWYVDSKLLAEKYNVIEVPTYLIFSNEGKLVYKESGFKGATEFIEMAKLALDPQTKAYYVQLDKYQKGVRDYDGMKELASKAKLFGDKKLAKEIAREYLRHVSPAELVSREGILFAYRIAGDKELTANLVRKYLDREVANMDSSMLYDKDLLFFISNFTNILNSKDRFFKLFYGNPAKVDSILESNGFAAAVVESIITKEIITSSISALAHPTDQTPDWPAYVLKIQRKYDKVDAAEVVLNYKIRYYQKIKNWSAWSTALDEKIGKHSHARTLDKQNAFKELNLPAWDAFLYCTDTGILKTALRWSDLSIELLAPGKNPQVLDTRANLLYKIGRVREAIAQELEAIDILKKRLQAPGANLQAINDSISQYTLVVEKMEKGLPTYEDQGAIWLKE